MTFIEMCLKKRAHNPRAQKSHELLQIQYIWRLCASMYPRLLGSWI
jgi:hypothetical protein